MQITLGNFFNLVSDLFVKLVWILFIFGSFLFLANFFSTLLKTHLGKSSFHLKGTTQNFIKSQYMGSSVVLFFLVIFQRSLISELATDIFLFFHFPT